MGMALIMTASGHKSYLYVVLFPLYW